MRDKFPLITYINTMCFQSKARLCSSSHTGDSNETPGPPPVAVGIWSEPAGQRSSALCPFFPCFSCSTTLHTKMHTAGTKSRLDIHWDESWPFYCLPHNFSNVNNKWNAKPPLQSLRNYTVYTLIALHEKLKSMGRTYSRRAQGTSTSLTKRCASQRWAAYHSKLKWNCLKV